MDKSQVQRALHAGVVEITFTKLSGEERVMQCTLNEDMIPPATKTDPLSSKKVRSVVNDQVQVVYDVEKEGWRSFRWDSLKMWAAGA